MSTGSAAWVVSLTSPGIEERTAEHNAALMIFLNRMVKFLDLDKLPDPNDRVTLRDMRSLCSGICLEYRTPEPHDHQGFQGFYDYIVRHFHRMAGQQGW